MSDAPGSGNWWQASDGKWYPPPPPRTQPPPTPSTTPPVSATTERVKKGSGGLGCLTAILVMVGAAAAIGVAVAVTGDDEEDSGIEITRDEFGDEWPLTVESGMLRCETVYAVKFESGGVVYAVNGDARGQAEDEGWVDFERIWADNPANPPLRINVGPVIERGLALCE